MADVDLTKEPLPSDAPVDTKSKEGEESFTPEEQLLRQTNARLEHGWSWWDKIYLTGREDVRFCYEDQWPDYAKAGRKNRPMLTMNMLPEFVNQVVGQARQAKFGIQIQQLSGKNDLMADASGKSNYQRSQVMEGLIRDIEMRSKAHHEYCRGLQHAVEAAVGWLMIYTMQPVDDPFNIELRIRHLKHRWSALIDPNAEKEDFSDAEWCSNAADIPKDEFLERWPDVPPASFSGGGSASGRNRSQSGSYWQGAEESVRATDFWWREPMQREALELVSREDETSRLVLYKDEFEPVLDELKDEGYEVQRSEKVDSFRVKYMRCIYNHILEGPHDWPSSMLPLIPVLGRKVNLDRFDTYIGLLRYAHDPQRMFNFWASAATERVALSPRNPYIAPASAIRGHEQKWENMYTNNEPVLLYEYEPDMPPPRREPPATMPAAELQLLGQSRSTLQDTIGMHEAALGQRSNETSGVAIQRRQQAGHSSTFEFLDNTAMAITRVGEVLVDMIPRIYTANQARRIVMPDDSTVMIHLNHEIEDRQTGKKFKINSLDFARYACRVTLGPATTTQREEFVELMMEWGRSDPEGFRVVKDLVVANMDFPMAREIAARLRVQVPRHMLSPEEQEKLPPEEPTPAQELAMLQAKAEQAKAEADMATAQSNVRIAELRVQSEQLRLEFEKEKGLNKQEDQAEVQRAKLENAGDDGEMSPAMMSTIKRMVAEAVAQSA